MPGEREDDLDPLLGEPGAEPAVDAAVDEHQREPDDDRRDRERQVDQPVEDRLAAEVLADEDERAGDPEDRVQRHRDRGDQDRQIEGVQRLGRRHRVQRVRDAVLERLEEDQDHRDQQQREQVAERDPAQAVLGEPALARAPRTGPGSIVAASAGMAQAPPGDDPDRDQDDERDHEQDDRDGRRGDLAVALDLAEDEDRGDLGLERDVPRDQDQRAELADRAGERERDAGEDRRASGSGG